MKNRSFKVLCHKQIQNAKSKRCPDRAFGQDGGGTWSMAGWSSDRGSAPHVLLGNPDGVDPDSLARSVSSRRGVPTPCTRGRSPLRSIAHSTRGRILSGRLFTFSGYFISGIPCADISYPEFRAPTFYIRISHSRMGEEDVSTSPVRHIRIL
uniref:Uncharacterized protein n=1 Tax=Vitis vinifera TaxID=29760 RepID=A5BL29_VITVI|nr:hypothetical protein VITISV_044086 [Vitis vinifera]